MKLRLRKWVKVVLTIMSVGVIILLYVKAGIWGKTASTNTLHAILCIGAWDIMFLQLPIINAIWEN